MEGYLIGTFIGLFLSIFDLVFLGLTKEIYLGNFTKNWLIIACIGYSLVPYIFYKGLSYTSLTILNLSWDITSDILVTMAGIFFFKEYLGYTKAIGIVLACITLLLFSVDDIIHSKK
jgi:EamA domain-containing membrane protein RarD